MTLLREARRHAHAVAAVDRAAASAEGEGAHRLQALRALVSDRSAHARVRGVFRALAHHGPQAADVDAVARAYDRAAAADPETSVAAYALGCPSRLAAVTGQVVAALEGSGALAPAMDVLDVGCGIGRFCAALAPPARSVLGLDVSEVMLAQAARRCAPFANVAVRSTDGKDLRAAHGRAFDLVLAVDVFPYLVSCGVAEAHVRDAAALLRPGGHLAIFNFAYGDGPDPAALAAAHGLAVAVAGARPCADWDGVYFLFRKPA